MIWCAGYLRIQSEIKIFLIKPSSTNLLTTSRYGPTKRLRQYLAKWVTIPYKRFSLRFALYFYYEITIAKWVQNPF